MALLPHSHGRPVCDYRSFGSEAFPPSGSPTTHRASLAGASAGYIRGSPQLRDLGGELAAFHQLGISLDDLKCRLLVLAPEADVTLALADAKIAHRQVGQPCWKRWVDI